MLTRSKQWIAHEALHPFAGSVDDVVTLLLFAWIVSCSLFGLYPVFFYYYSETSAVNLIFIWKYIFRFYALHWHLGLFTITFWIIERPILSIIGWGKRSIRKSLYCSNDIYETRDVFFEIYVHCTYSYI